MKLTKVQRLFYTIDEKHHAIIFPNGDRYEVSVYANPHQVWRYTTKNTTNITYIMHYKDYNTLLKEINGKD